MKTAIALSIATVFASAAANAALINVNFNGFTGGSPPGGPAQVQAELEGPAGGLGTTWNQFAANSGGGLLDSTGGATGASFTTNFTEGRYDGTGPSLRMLRATLTDFGRGQSRTLTINGLNAGSLYNVWVVSHRHQSGGAPNYIERQLGTWTSVNTTSSPTSQVINGVSSGVSPQGNAFVDGVNYALFENVVANGSGTIVFNGQAATIAGGFAADYRLHLSGFQIEEVITAPIPEPSSAILLGLGGLVLFIRRRK